MNQAAAPFAVKVLRAEIDCLRAQIGEVSRRIRQDENISAGYANPEMQKYLAFALAQLMTLEERELKLISTVKIYNLL